MTSRRAKFIACAIIEYCSSLRIRRLTNMVSKLSISGGQRNERKRTRKQAAKQPAKAAVSLRSAPLGTSIVEHFNLKVIQRFPAFSSFDHFNYCFFFFIRMPKLHETEQC